MLVIFCYEVGENESHKAAHNDVIDDSRLAVNNA